LTEPFPQLPHLPDAEDWRLSIWSELGRLGEPRVRRVYDALHAYNECYHSYFEAIREYSGVLAEDDSSTGHLTELRMRIADIFGEAEIAFSRAYTEIRQLATELHSGGSGIGTSSPQQRSDSPSRSSVLTAERRAGIPARRPALRRSRSRSRSSW
jgi:hypothetical protein